MLPAARRFKDLGVGASKTLDQLEAIDPELRPIVKPELLGAVDDEPAMTSADRPAGAMDDAIERGLAATSTRPSD